MTLRLEEVSLPAQKRSSSGTCHVVSSTTGPGTIKPPFFASFLPSLSSTLPVIRSIRAVGEKFGGRLGRKDTPVGAVYDKV